MIIKNEENFQRITIKLTNHLSEQRFIKHNANFRTPPDFNKSILKYFIKLLNVNIYINEYIVLTMPYLEKERINFLFKIELNKYKDDLIDVILVSSIITNKLFPYRKVDIKHRIYSDINYSFYINILKNEENIKEEQCQKLIKHNKNLPGLKIIKKGNINEY